ncbi:hypothetical protein M3Y97_00122700 [Aphelenchoides bicaudatus]|nr:hypothetical protein M3Y97_00122700 [Aphelenchoides bicaudatus]
MGLDEDNIVEKIILAYKRNDNKLIAKASRYLANHPATVLNLKEWKTVDNEIRIQLLEKALIYKDEASDDSDNDDSKPKPVFEPKIEFFQQPEGFGGTKMFIKNTGNCRVAFKIVADMYGNHQTTEEPRFSCADEVFEIQNASFFQFRASANPHYIHYLEAKECDSSADQVVAIDAINKKYQIKVQQRL